MAKKKDLAKKAIIPDEVIERKIYIIRGRKVMLDKDLAALYGVTTGRLNEQVKRNRKRFPPDFMYQLTKNEVTDLISHFAISSNIRCFDNFNITLALKKWTNIIHEGTID